MVKKLIPLLLVFAIASSGCIGLFEEDPETPQGDGGDPGEGDEGSDGMDDMDDPDGEGDPDTDPETNQPPEASMSANVTRGPAPLKVMLTLSASDPDEDEIDWTLDLGQGDDPVTGETLESEMEVTFDQVGNFTLVFNVSDGSDTTEEELMIRVVETNEPVQIFAGGWMLTVPAYCGVAGAGVDELMGVFTNGTLVDDASIGLGFTANFTTETNDAILDYIVTFVDADFNVLDSFTEAPGEDVTGTVPEQADMVYFSACGVSGPVDVVYAAG